MTQQRSLCIPLLLFAFLSGCSESQSTDLPTDVDPPTDECQVTQVPFCESDLKLKICVGGKYKVELCAPHGTCQNGACVQTPSEPECKDTALPVCSDDVTVKSCNKGVWSWQKCQNNATCTDGRCIPQNTLECTEDEIKCLDSKVLQRCENGSLTLTSCDDGELCQVNACIKSSSIEYVNGVWVLPLSAKPYTTLQQSYKPTATRFAIDSINNHELNATQFRYFQRYGLDLVTLPGEPWVIKESLLSANDPMLSHKGDSVAYLWQFADPQLIDEESPVRIEGTYYSPFVVASAYRPQGHLSVQMLDIHIQSAMRLSSLSTRPFDFILSSGDIADNSQKNELLWHHALLKPGVVDPDSGIDDDPVPGPNNDFADPFYAKGIGSTPIFPALGNHDILYMGFAVITEKIQNGAVGNIVVDLFSYLNEILGSHENRESYRNGFRDASKVDAPVVAIGNTPPDPNRQLSGKKEALQILAQTPNLPKDQGFDPDLIKQGWGYYVSHPIPGKPIKLITLDTNAPTFSEASLDRVQFDWIKAEIQKSREAKELVILHSHHSTHGLAGEVSEGEFVNAMAAYSGVILHLVGHGHNNNSRLLTNAAGRGYWELMVASTVDFPSQSRIVEIVHEGKGIISIYVTNLDANAAPRSLVAEALPWAAARRFFSIKADPTKAWEDEKPHRNMILRTKVEKSIADELDKYTWSKVIESEETLLNL